MTVEALERSLVRGLVVLALLAVLAPGGLLALFQRQAGRLDALADHGRGAEATVTAKKEGVTYYAYEVDGASYSSSVREREVAPAIGEAIAITYLPELPSFSRPVTDRSLVASEAASNRAVAGRVVVGVFWFFAANAVIVYVRLRRLRATGKTEAEDPHAYRTRLILTGVLLLAPMMSLVVGWHASDAARRDESIGPVVGGAVLSLVILGGTTFHVLRRGAAHAGSRSRDLLRWAAPLAMAIAAIRALAWLLSR